MKRNLIVGERIMYVDAQTSVNCVFVAKIQGNIEPGRLYAALSKLQAKHPLLRVGIRENKNGRPYFTAEQEVPDIPVHIIERLADDDWKSASEAEWKTQFHTEQGPLARVVWLRSAAISELLLVCPHCISDGATCVTLMREMLALLDEPGKEMKAYALFSSIKELIPPTLLIDKKKMLKAVLFSLLARIALSFKSMKPKVPRGKDYVIHWKFNQRVTASLVERCKAKGTSVHAALCVALLGAFKHVKKDKAHNKAICPVDIRKFIPEIKDDMMFAFAPVVELSANDDPKTGFWEKARQLKDDLSGKIAVMKAYEILMTSEYLHPSARKLVDYLKYTEGTHDFTFSNMGRLNIPAEYHSFEVETIYSPTVAFPWRNSNTIVASTFRGQMDFTFMSNDSFLPYDDAIAIRGKAIALLVEEVVEMQDAANVH